MNFLLEVHRRLSVWLCRKNNVLYDLKKGDAVRLKGSGMRGVIVNVNYSHASTSAAIAFGKDLNSVAVYSLWSIERDESRQTQ